MSMKQNFSFRFFKIKKRAKRIFQINYEDLSTQIYYDVKNTFRILILRNNTELLLEREISRAQAFRIMNTRYLN